MTWRGRSNCRLRNRSKIDSRIILAPAPPALSRFGAASVFLFTALGLTSVAGTHTDATVTRTGDATTFSLNTLIVSSTGGAHSVPGTFTHYVSPTGSATWANAVNIGTPCSYATAMTNAVGGDTVGFRGGTYTIDFTGASYETPAIRPTNSGSLGLPITFIKYTAETPVFNGNPADASMAVFGVRDRDYVIFDGFTGTMASEVNTAWLCVFLGTTVGATNNCIVRNCTFYGSGVNTNGNNSAPIRFDLCVACEARNNSISGNEGAFTGINSCGIWLFTARQCIIRNNEIFNCENGIMQKNPNNRQNEIYYNFIHNIGTNGMNFNEQDPAESTGANYIHDNLLIDIGVIGIYFGDSYDTPWYRVNHNTFVRCALGIGTAGSNGYQVFELQDNIFYESSSAFVQAYASWPIFILDRNCYYNAATLTWYQDYNTPINSLTAWRTFTGLDTNAITTNPLFVNAAGITIADFALQGGSPCVGTGTGGTNRGVQNLSLIGIQ